MLDVLKTRVLPLIQNVVSEFQEDNVPVLSSSLAYFALFSIFPLLLVILSLVGIFLGSSDSVLMRSLDTVGAEGVLAEQTEQVAVEDQLFEFLRTSVSPEVAQQIEATLANLNKNGVGAGLIGFLVLLWSASNIFGQLDRAFQVIWDIEDQPKSSSGVVGSVLTVVKKRVFAFGLVIFSALVMLISMLSGVVLNVVRSLVENNLIPDIPGSDFVWQLAQFGISFGLLFIVVLMLFKYLPDARVTFGDVWIGALITSVLFTLLINLSSSFIGGGSFEAYGVVGSLMVMLLWIFLTSMLLFLGAEFTQVYATMYGSHRPQTPEHATAQSLETAIKPGLTAQLLAEECGPDSAAPERPANDQSEQTPAGSSQT